MKQKIIAIIGAISTALGGIGAAIAATGFCACNLTVLLSFAGMISLVAGFFSTYKLTFLAIGVFLLVLSLIFFKRSKICKIHKKSKDFSTYSSKPHNHKPKGLKTHKHK